MLYLHRQAELVGQGRAAEGVADQLAVIRLHGSSVRAVLILQQLADVVQQSSRKEVVHVDRQPVAIDLLEQLRGPVRSQGHGAHVLDIAGRARVDEQGEGHLVQAIRCPAATLHRRFPHLDRLFLQILILNQRELGH